MRGVILAWGVEDGYIPDGKSCKLRWFGWANWVPGWFGSGFIAENPRTERPNLLLIMTDQHRGDCLSIDGHPIVQTPNLDFLARSGTRFRRGYSESPVCIPARRTLMSGIAPAGQGMVGYQDGVEWRPQHTLASELARAGYQTQMVGKLHLHPPRKRFGFDHLQLADASRPMPGSDYADWLRDIHGRREVEPGVAHGIHNNGWVGRPHHLPEEQMLTFWCVDQALRFMQKRDPTVPYFLNVSFADPHPPFTPPAFYYDRYIHRDLPPAVIGDWATDDFQAPLHGASTSAPHVRLDEHQLRCARAAYYGMINFIDDQVGRLLTTAQRYGLLQNTLVVFVSDHGEMLGDHHRFLKSLPYEASARVPFMIRAPSQWHAPAEQVCQTPVGLQDLMPTLLDAAGLDVPAACTGRSLVPILRGETDRVRQVLHGECTGQRAHHYLTDGMQKYIWFSKTGEEQLFDLQQSPNDEHDLVRSSDAGPDIARWRQRLCDVLRDRPEGFTDGQRLVPGRPHEALVPGYDPQCFRSFH